ncbi:hypothetical protein [Nocardia asteroides]|uniref:hypothetical protein n=1 Tax=Nocardia asteroides TaxID=1824 RepID=UPI001E28AC15|nr:hypothetical protein [Nocardia asteroides]UGT55186.1 hypothetical protein LTT85_32170 [Nocardia asteroides]
MLYVTASLLVYPWMNQSVLLFAAKVIDPIDRTAMSTSLHESRLVDVGNGYEGAWATTVWSARLTVNYRVRIGRSKARSPKPVNVNYAGTVLRTTAPAPVRHVRQVSAFARPSIGSNSVPS